MRIDQLELVELSLKLGRKVDVSEVKMVLKSPPEGGDKNKVVELPMCGVVVVLN